MENESQRPAGDEPSTAEVRVIGAVLVGLGVFGCWFLQDRYFAGGLVPAWSVGAVSILFGAAAIAFPQNPFLRDRIGRLARFGQKL